MSFDLPPNPPLTASKPTQARISAVAALPGCRVVSSSDDGSLRVWNLATGETVRTREGHSGPVRAVAALPDDHVVSASDDCSLRVWDLATGTAVARLTLETPVISLAAIGAGRIVAALGRAGLAVFHLEENA